MVEKHLTDSAIATVANIGGLGCERPEAVGPLQRSA